jgi:hypothetical protein
MTMRLRDVESEVEDPQRLSDSINPIGQNAPKVFEKFST